MREAFVYKVPATITQVVETYKKTSFFVASMKKAGARSVEIVEEEALPDGGRRWKAKITENQRLPQFLRTSDILIIVNESAFYPPMKRLTFRITPAKPLRVKLEGTIDAREAGDETELLYSLDLSVRLPLFGKQTETVGLKVVREECRKQAALLAEWALGITESPVS